MLKKFFKINPAVKLNCFFSDTAEISFLQYGPTLAVSLALLADQKMVFVHELSCDLTHQGTGMKRHFSWFALRPHRFETKNYHEFELKMPSKFMISPKGRWEYNILFSDRDGYAEIKTLLKDYRHKWNALGDSLAPAGKTPEDRFEEFLKNPEITALHKDLLSRIYWQAGDYALSFKIATRNPSSEIEVFKSFSLTAEEALILKNNSFSIETHILKQKLVPYSFIYPKLQ